MFPYRTQSNNFVSFFAVNDTKRKQKVLGPNQKLKFNPTELIIYCKDFRIVRFRFDEAGPESAKKVLLSCYEVIACSNSCADKNILYYYILIEKWGEELQIIHIYRKISRHLESNLLGEKF